MTPDQKVAAEATRHNHPLFSSVVLMLLTEIINSRLFTTVSAEMWSKRWQMLDPQPYSCHKTCGWQCANVGADFKQPCHTMLTALTHREVDVLVPKQLILLLFVQRCLS